MYLIILEENVYKRSSSSPFETTKCLNYNVIIIYKTTNSKIEIIKKANIIQ